jgi:sec-independent protein translocase protein TatC
MKKTVIGILKDIKKHLLVYCAFVFVFFCIFFYKRDTLYGFITKPLLNKFDVKDLFVYTGILDMFFADMSLCLSTSFILTLPVLLFCVYNFLSPSLYKHEKKGLLIALVSGLFMFYLSVIVVYNCLLPQIVRFFVMNDKTIAKPMLNINTYISTFFQIILVVGLLFEFPIVLSVLAKYGFVNSKMLLKRGKEVIVIAFVICAIITPPDVVSQIFCALILIMMYFLSIGFIRFFLKK